QRPLLLPEVASSRSRHWWPPTFAGAPNTLRVVAMNQAAKRLILNLQDAWIQKRQAELSSARG
ncbi:MAG TPA: hypothetical protein VJM82_04540, partial [Nitrospiraceae bacterium]|nr:hypothetical protein [Nitrospiraceae bacterium]